MIIFYVASVITTAIVSVWATAVVGVAIRNQLVQRHLKQLQYWQQRAVDAEYLAQRLSQGVIDEELQRAIWFVLTFVIAFAFVLPALLNAFMALVPIHRPSVAPVTLMMATDKQ